MYCVGHSKRFNNKWMYKINVRYLSNPQNKQQWQIKEKMD